MLFIATSIAGLEECVCREVGHTRCFILDKGLIVFEADDPSKALSMHSIASLAIIIGVYGLVKPSRRFLRYTMREPLYTLRDSGVSVSGVRVWCNDKRIRGTLKVIGARETRRVFRGGRSGSRLWLIYSRGRLWLGLEIARRIYARHWVTSAGLNPIVAYCLVQYYRQLVENKRVLEVFAGGATMALEACRLGAKHSVGVEVDEKKAFLSLENAFNSKLDVCYDPVISDAFNPPFREKAFSIVLGDPPRGRRFSAISLRKLVGVLRKLSRRKTIIVYDRKTLRGRIVRELVVGGKKIIIVELL